MFTLRQYLNSLSDPDGLTRTLGHIDICRRDGRLCYSAGNSAVVFRIHHNGQIRSLRCYTKNQRNAEQIYGDRLLRQELFVYDSPTEGLWTDVVLGQWIEGATLQQAATEAALASDTDRLARLATAFDSLALELIRDNWAHGDLKPENIIVDTAGKMHLIDFDAVFLPEFAGQQSPELGTAAFQHPARTSDDFDSSLDDYPAALISTALHALALAPALYLRYKDSDGLLFCPNKIHTDPALAEALSLFENEGLAVQYRVARMLFSPTLRLTGLAELFSYATAQEPAAGIAKEAATDSNQQSGTKTNGEIKDQPTAVKTVIGSTAHNKLAGTAIYYSGESIMQSTAQAPPRQYALNIPRGRTAITAAKLIQAGISRPQHTKSPQTAPSDVSLQELPAMPATALPSVTQPSLPPELFVQNGLWGYRTDRHIVIPPLYDSGFDFTEGLAAVQLGRAWHFIDTSGRIRLNCAGCEAVKPFRGGRAKIIRDGVRKEIDLSGLEFEI